MDYLVRLEQGRAQNPSSQVLAALARALRLSVDERDVLYRSAGIASPSRGVISAHLSPGLQRILDHLTDTPVGVYTAAWDFVVGNHMWHALFGDQTPLSGRESNLIWRAFVTHDIPLVRSTDQTDDFAQEMVSDLHTAMSIYPDDPGLIELVTDLRAASPAFAACWGNWHVANRRSERKTVDSPVVGHITFDCDVLSTTDSDLRVVVYTAPVGSADAAKLDLLRVVGIQTCLLYTSPSPRDRS